jgi:hypothetical protein
VQQGKKRKKVSEETTAAEPATAKKPSVAKSAGKSGGRGKSVRKPETDRFANSRPVKKGKGSVKKK